VFHIADGSKLIKSKVLSRKEQVIVESHDVFREVLRTCYMNGKPTVAVVLDKKALLSPLLPEAL